MYDVLFPKPHALYMTRQMKAGKIGDTNWIHCHDCYGRVTGTRIASKLLAVISFGCSLDFPYRKTQEHPYVFNVVELA